MIKQLITDERFVNIQKAQAGLTKLLLSAQKSETFYRVLKNDQPLGVLIPESLWQSFTEDLEALSSPNYRQRIVKARKEKGAIKASDLKKKFGL